MLLQFIYILVFGSAPSVHCFTSRIIGGSNAQPGEFPFVAQIQVTGQHWCNGYIYNDKWIVTTAACVIGYRHQPDALTVTVGQTDPTNLKTEQIISVSAIQIHENYSHSSRSNDVAMLQLSMAIVLGNYSTAITSGNLNSSREAIVACWTDASAGEMKTLRYTNVPIRPDDACSTVYNQLWDSASMFCAGNATNDACNQGDAGAPLVQGTSQSFHVVGLVSHTVGCGDPLYPTVYTRLSSYSTWMEDKGGAQVIPTVSTTEITTMRTDPTAEITTERTDPTTEITTEEIVLTSPVVSQCSTASSSNQFPFMVSVLSSSTLSHLCAGFIYNERFIVTAASCVIRKTGPMLNVTVGQFRFDRPEADEKIFPVMAVTLHPQYRESNQTNNIALVQISRSITFGANVNFIFYDSVMNDYPCSVSGWASTLGDTCVRSLSLLWDDSEIIQANADCSQSLISSFDSSTMLCTKKAADNCEFESGAPLIQGTPPVVVGIKSVSQECSKSSHVVYTRISYYFNWLISAVFGTSWVYRNMLRVVWIAWACTILASVADSSVLSSRVVGGTDVNSKQFPFIVQIQTKGEHRCAGYIYNANWIVTTAVCVYGYKLSDFKVVVGQVSLIATDPGEEYFDVISNHIHESYDAATMRNNIAMLQLSRLITFNDYSSPVAHGELPITAIDGTLLGWGNAGSGNIASTLKYAIVPVVQDGTCPSIDSGVWDPTSMICAGDAIHNACNGDAGGPLVLGTSVSNYMVVGLVSHSTTCFSPTAYIRLSFYTAWMRGVGGETSPVPTTLAQTSTTSTTVTTEVVTPSTPATTTVSQTTTTQTTQTETTQTETTQAQTSNANVDITTEAATTTAFFQTCNVASAGQFPFIVSVGDLLSGRHSCAGFIYNANYVVTTASCVALLDQDTIVITAGSSRLNIPGADYLYGAQQVVTNTKGDIALIQTSRSFTFNENVNFIRFDQANYNEPASTVTGWASTEAGGCTTSLDLLWGPTSLTSQISNCESLIPNFDAGTMICVAGSANRNYNAAAIVGSCRFENGAPLIQGMPPLVIGIKSLVEPSCSTGQVFTIYTRISTFFDWLLISAGPQP
ncbi:hypothetical protein GHT06_016571 [Daphnia sinensis]|uniref:Peptidase S1 domain-containing protein n=1 Tax=Daphnia sinensis TaxID=1820382 RepID=A0AAD5L5X8_9CRUS|nr:hypothetical protein GHT06_016571 [Daphnia sinensis]